MIKRLKRIAPLQAGKVLGLLYGLISLIFVPFVLLAALLGAFAQTDHSNGMAAGTLAAGVMIALALLLPIFYGVMGFIFGVVSAALYNLIAKWTGGMEFEIEDVARVDSGASSLPIA